MADYAVALVDYYFPGETQVDPATIRVELTHATAPALLAVVGGVFQAGFAGAITAVGKGYRVQITTLPSALAPGTWTVTVDAASEAGELL